MTKSILFGTVILLMVAAVSEIGAYFATSYMYQSGFLYKPQATGNYAAYLADHDPINGWPAPNQYGGRTFDSSGARVSPAFPDNSQENCIALYGDSFTFAAEVGHADTWGNLLAQRVECRVANFGVGAYGTDQAYIRFLHHEPAIADVVMLGHMSENILRNVNQYRDLLYPPGQGIGFKPRFLLEEDGGLKFVPMPTISEEEYSTFIENPDDFLEHEYFLPGGLSGLHIWRFPYTLAAIHATGHERLYSKAIRREPWYVDFYRYDHPAQGLQITTQIIKAFRDEALARNQTPVVLLIPNSQDLLHYRNHQEWVYQPLLDNLEAVEIQPLNIGPSIIEQLQDRDPCELFFLCRGGSHYNQEGNQIFAKILHRWLTERNLLD